MGKKKRPTDLLKQMSFRDTWGKSQL